MHFLWLLHKVNISFRDNYIDDDDDDVYYYYFYFCVSHISSNFFLKSDGFLSHTEKYYVDIYSISIIWLTITPSYKYLESETYKRPVTLVDRGFLDLCQNWTFPLRLLTSDEIICGRKNCPKLVMPIFS